MSTLPQLVKEVKHRLAQAEKFEAKADDHRLAASLRIAECRERVKAGEAGKGVKWREWAPEQFGVSYREVKRLARVGSAEDPEQALKELRQQGAEAARKRREQQKLIGQQPKPEDVEAEVSAAAEAAVPDRLYDAAQVAFLAMPLETRRKFAEWVQFVLELD